MVHAAKNSDSRISKIEAAVEAAKSDPLVRAPALRFALGSLRSHGINLDDAVNDGEIDIVRLDTIMASALRPVPTERQIAIKTALHRAGLCQ